MAFFDTQMADHVPATRLGAYEGFKSLSVAAAALTVIIAGLLAIYPRMFGAEPTWLKPFKFAVSFAVLFATLAFLTQKLSHAHRFGLVAGPAVFAGGAAFLFEVALIVGQAARVESALFAESAAFREMMCRLMRAGAAAPMASIFAVGALVLIDRAAGIGRATRLPIVLGAVVTVVPKDGSAANLQATGGRFIGQPSPRAVVIPILGWSMKVGDLRSTHFLSLHAMQVIPLIGCTPADADMRPLWSGRRPRSIAFSPLSCSFMRSTARR